MILVETSVLIDFFREIRNPKVDKFSEVLQKGIPFGICPHIYQELLQGCKSEKSFRLLKEYLDTQRFFQLKQGIDSYAQAAKIYFDLRKRGKSLRSTIDCLIAQTAIENDLFLLHNDADFDLISLVAPLKIF